LRDWLGEAKAKQVYLVLRDRILSGAFGFGAKLPIENELAEYCGVSRVTVRRALGELARERFIERRRSAGTRVVYRPSPAPMTADISGVLANLADMGRCSAVKLLAFDYVAGGRGAGAGDRRRSGSIAAAFDSRARHRPRAVLPPDDARSRERRRDLHQTGVDVAAAA
jgi:Bacterial regulatory proteins, gntR family